MRILLHYGLICALQSSSIIKSVGHSDKIQGAASANLIKTLSFNTENTPKYMHFFKQVVNILLSLCKERLTMINNCVSTSH